jgi:hypothetical protein
MSLWEKGNESPSESPDHADNQLYSEGQDAVLDLKVDEALRKFKLSVDALSEAAYSNRGVAQSVPRRNWRPAAAWALGCALMASSVSGVVYRRQEKELKAKQDLARLVEQQKQIAASQAADEEDLLASVDSDVSRQVPSAMEPLAQMAEDESK